MIDPTLDHGEQKLVSDVARHGWHCMRVGSRIDDPVQVTFAYSIGLEASRDWPELICFGLDLDVLHQLLSAAIDELGETATLPRPGLLLAKVVNGYSCRLDAFPLSHHRHHLGWAYWFAQYQGRRPGPIRCLQLVWPDRVGRFPDDPACVPEVREVQQPAA